MPDGWAAVPRARSVRGPLLQQMDRPRSRLVTGPASGEQKVPAKGSREARLRNAGGRVCAATREAAIEPVTPESVSHVSSQSAPLPGEMRAHCTTSRDMGSGGKTPGPRDPPGDLEKGPFLRFNTGERRSYFRPMDY